MSQLRNSVFPSCTYLQRHWHAHHPNPKPCHLMLQPRLPGPRGSACRCPCSCALINWATPPFMGVVGTRASVCPFHCGYQLCRAPTRQRSLLRCRAPTSLRPSAVCCTQSIFSNAPSPPKWSHPRLLYRQLASLPRPLLTRGRPIAQTGPAPSRSSTTGLPEASPLMGRARRVLCAWPAHDTHFQRSTLGSCRCHP